MAEIVLWQYRWLNPGDDPNPPPSMLEWQEVKPWNPHMQTVEQRVEELRDFRYRGKPAYEVRALGVIPAGVTPPAQPDKGEAFRQWQQHPIFPHAKAMTHFDAGWNAARGVPGTFNDQQGGA